ncbi:hypothetical protein GDO81_019221 [Engystomops pustulosus]|uniref:Uncharacterized protein n=1 Tax=Engystomops pustulosus TaxID=76066 RepID=A0AAV6ZAV3_ENGPU|nr:hypothetical protein GDO81_019221 [Engystomops pustulosus]
MSSSVHRESQQCHNGVHPDLILEAMEQIGEPCDQDKRKHWTYYRYARCLWNDTTHGLHKTLVDICRYRASLVHVLRVEG